ncbi:MAG: peptidase domain-containing ABC transporter, partial [Prevotella sp.]|nr:peptidase domain-containing ABC transporter [Prevotella sp.]
MNKPFPIFTQHDVMECGPTCLRMVMAYYGRNYPLERLRDMCHIQRDGVSLLGVAEAAEQLGMHTTGVKATLQQLVDEVPLPCILHWNQGHFVVLYEVKRTKEGLQFKVADPVGQRITYTEREFLRYWASDTEEGQPAGIALMLEPTPDFNCDEYVEDDSDRKARKRSLMLLLSYMRPYKRLIAQLFLGLTVVSLLQLVLPFLTQAIVDFGISRQDLGFIVLVLIAQLMLMIGSTSVQFIQSWILLHVSTRVNLSLLSDYLAKLMRLPFSYFDTRLTGDILQRIDDHDRIQTFLTGSSLSLILSLFNIVVFGAVILIYDWRIFFIFMLGSALYVLWV